MRRAGRQAGRGPDEPLQRVGPHRGDQVERLGAVGEQERAEPERLGRLLHVHLGVPGISVGGYHVGSARQCGTQLGRVRFAGRLGVTDLRHDPTAGRFVGGSEVLGQRRAVRIVDVEDGGGGPALGRHRAGHPALQRVRRDRAEQEIPPAVGGQIGDRRGGRGGRDHHHRPGDGVRFGRADRVAARAGADDRDRAAVRDKAERRGGRVRGRILGDQPDRKAGRGKLLRGQLQSPEHRRRLRHIGGSDISTPTGTSVCGAASTTGAAAASVTATSNTAAVRRENRRRRDSRGFPLMRASSPIGPTVSIGVSGRRRS